MKKRVLFLITLGILVVWIVIWIFTGGIIIQKIVGHEEDFETQKAARESKEFLPIMKGSYETNEQTILPFLLYYEKIQVGESITILTSDVTGNYYDGYEQFSLSKLEILYENGYRQTIIPSTNAPYYGSETGGSIIHVDSTTYTFPACAYDAEECYGSIGPFVLESKGPFTIEISGVSRDEQEQRDVFEHTIRGKEIDEYKVSTVRGLSE